MIKIAVTMKSRFRASTSLLLFLIALIPALSPGAAPACGLQRSPEQH